jgi:hypothetical protein
VSQSKARDWDKTIAKLFEKVPEAQDVDWDGLFRDDPMILGDIINDIIKVGVSKKGRPGKRSASNAADIENDLRRLTQKDYTSLPARQALINLMGTDKSMRFVAHASGLDKMTVHRLLSGKREFTLEDFEALAKAFRKSPSYFMEYRVAYICMALSAMLVKSGEASTIFYEKLRKVS